EGVSFQQASVSTTGTLTTSASTAVSLSNSASSTLTTVIHAGSTNGGDLAVSSTSGSITVAATDSGETVSIEGVVFQNGAISSATAIGATGTISTSSSSALSLSSSGTSPTTIIHAGNNGGGDLQISSTDGSISVDATTTTEAVTIETVSFQNGAISGASTI